jgi:hypothetical protein
MARKARKVALACWKKLTQKRENQRNQLTLKRQATNLPNSIKIVLRELAA